MGSRGLCPYFPRISCLRRRKKFVVDPPNSPKTHSSRPTLHDIPSAASTPSRCSPTSRSPNSRGSPKVTRPSSSVSERKSEKDETQTGAGEDSGEVPATDTKRQKSGQYRRRVHPGDKWPFKEVHTWPWNPTLRFDVEKLKDHGVLDQTNISEVRRVSFHGRFFALKVIDKSTSPQPAEAYTREVLLLQRLCGQEAHPQIVELLGVCETYERLCLLFDLCNFGRSTEFLRIEAERCPNHSYTIRSRPLGIRLEVSDGFHRVCAIDSNSPAQKCGIEPGFILVGSPEQLSTPIPISCCFRDYRPLLTVSNYLVKDLLESMIYLHKMRIVHGDIKPDNVLVTNGERGREYVAKVCDFGHARALGPREVLQGVSGTPGFRAPEVEMGYRFDGYRADMFSVGRTLSAWLALPSAEQRWMIREMSDRDAERRPTALYALAALFDDVSFFVPPAPFVRKPPSRSLYSCPSR